MGLKYENMNNRIEIQLKNDITAIGVKTIMKKNNEKWKYPRTRIQWLWDNMKGYRALYVLAMFGTVVYNILQLTVPFFSGQIVNRFLSGDGAKENLANHPDEFIRLLCLMVGLTILRCIIVYFDCMGYEYVSQAVLFKV